MKLKKRESEDGTLALVSKWFYYGFQSRGVSLKTSFFVFLLDIPVIPELDADAGPEEEIQRLGPSKR